MTLGGAGPWSAAIPWMVERKLSLGQLPLPEAKQVERAAPVPSGAGYGPVSTAPGMCQEERHGCWITGRAADPIGASRCHQPGHRRSGTEQGSCGAQDQLGHPRAGGKPTKGLPAATTPHHRQPGRGRFAAWEGSEIRNGPSCHPLLKC